MVEIHSPREVPLGGLRALTVRRTLPLRHRTLIGAWCFIDHYGPTQVDPRGAAGEAARDGMVVAPHPHTGLQTVSWLFAGEIQHRDSAGHEAIVRPGELNLMTAGQGISHSEVSPQSAHLLHGAQLWLALPHAMRHVAPTFRHYAPPLVTAPGVEARVFLGTLLGSVSPVPTFSPLVGAELVIEPHARVRLAVSPAYEHGVLVDQGSVRVQGDEMLADQLAYVEPGTRELELTAGDQLARVLLLGGEPFGEEVVMWWNFLGRTHEEIVQFREEWQAQIAGATTGREVAAGRFGVVHDELAPIPAPPLPNLRLKPRA